jgi:hypothetical protein
MQGLDKNAKKRAASEAAPLDPIALTLALWLGMIVGVTGLIRLSESAAANAARAQDQRTVTMMRPLAFAPYGS